MGYRELHFTWWDKSVVLLPADDACRFVGDRLVRPANDGRAMDGYYRMSPDKQTELIPRFWEKCTRLRKLSIQSVFESSFDAGNREAFWNFHRLIYRLQVRGF